MEEHHRQILQKHSPLLYDQMDTMYVACGLESAGLLRKEHVQNIQAKKSTIEQNRELLSFIPTRGREVFGILVEILASDRGQKHLAEILKSDLEPAKIEITNTTKYESTTIVNDGRVQTAYHQQTESRTKIVLNASNMMTNREAEEITFNIMRNVLNMGTYLEIFPKSIILLMHLIIGSSVVDFSLVENVEDKNFEPLKHPDSMRRTIWQLGREAKEAFQIAENNMYSIGIKLRNIRGHFRDATEIDILGTDIDKDLRIIRPANQIKKQMKDCIEMAKEAEDAFKKLGILRDKIQDVLLNKKKRIQNRAAEIGQTIRFIQLQSEQKRQERVNNNEEYEKLKDDLRTSEGLYEDELKATPDFKAMISSDNSGSALDYLTRPIKFIIGAFKSLPGIRWLTSQPQDIELNVNAPLTEIFFIWVEVALEKSLTNEQEYTNMINQSNFYFVEQASSLKSKNELSDDYQLAKEGVDIVEEVKALHKSEIQCRREKKSLEEVKKGLDTDGKILENETTSLKNERQQLINTKNWLKSEKEALQQDVSQKESDEQRQIQQRNREGTEIEEERRKLVKEHTAIKKRDTDLSKEKQRCMTKEIELSINEGKLCTKEDEVTADINTFLFAVQEALAAEGISQASQANKSGQSEAVTEALVICTSDEELESSLEKLKDRKKELISKHEDLKKRKDKLRQRREMHETERLAYTTSNGKYQNDLQVFEIDRDLLNQKQAAHSARENFFNDSTAQDQERRNSFAKLKQQNANKSFQLEVKIQDYKTARATYDAKVKENQNKQNKFNECQRKYGADHRKQQANSDLCRNKRENLRKHIQELTSRAEIQAEKLYLRRTGEPSVPILFDRNHGVEQFLSNKLRYFHKRKVELQFRFRHSLKSEEEKLFAKIKEDDDARIKLDRSVEICKFQMEQLDRIGPIIVTEEILKITNAIYELTQQWDKVILFFTRTLQFVDHQLANSVQGSVDVFEEDSRAAKRTGGQCTQIGIDHLFRFLFESMGGIYALETLAVAYTKISEKYFMDELRKLDKLMMLSEIDPEEAKIVKQNLNKTGVKIAEAVDNILFEKQIEYIESIKHHIGIATKSFRYVESESLKDMREKFESQLDKGVLRKWMEVKSNAQLDQSINDAEAVHGIIATVSNN